MTGDRTPAGGSQALAGADHFSRRLKVAAAPHTSGLQ